MTSRLAITPKTRVRRKAERANYDTAAIYAAIDEMPFATVAFNVDNEVHAIPTAAWREGNHLYVHGSHGSRLIQVLLRGAQACVSITCLDGMVLARSALHHSMNYRSVCLYGVFEVVEEAGKADHLRCFMERWMPGRWQYVRQPTEDELAGVSILRIAITEAVVKSRHGGPEDKSSDMQWPVWAGVIPLQLKSLSAQQAHEQQETNLPGKSIKWGN